MNGIIFPSEGHYLYKGHEITEKALKDRQFAKWFHQQMGYVFQNADTQLFCGSVEEEVAFGPIQMGLSEAEVRERTEDCLRLFGIEKLRERPPYHLSGGEKRKVSLACILSLNPEVLSWMSRLPVCGEDAGYASGFCLKTFIMRKNADHEHTQSPACGKSGNAFCSYE